ncbi:MAG: NAD(P)/FAD-dependent oxidoreductase [Eubacteriales bacterium]|nr:NAD(P)/FAD-dependent oxidoreductase [Eubacteriales bacterium]
MQKVIIIGAGPAGLTAACELLKYPQQFSVTLLEESEEFGGISRTARWQGQRMDIGGHRFFTKEPRVAQWWLDRMPLQGAPAMDDALLGREKPLSEGGPDPEGEDAVMLARDRVSRIYYNRKFFDYPISMKPETIRNMGLWQTFIAGCSYLRACVIKKPETSLENFYINRFGRKLYSMFFEAYTEKLWGRHPRDISADWGAQRVKGLSIRALLANMFSKTFGKKQNETETSLIEQFWYPKFGPGQLWELAADEVRQKGGEILAGCRVERIRCQGGAVQAVVCRCGQEERVIEGDVFFSTMPIRDLVSGMEGDPVPAAVREVAQGLPYRDFVTVGLLVDRLKLQNHTPWKTLGDIVPDCWIYVQEPDVKMGRIQIFNNWSPYLVEKPADTVWMGLEYFCTKGDAFWNMSEEECVALAIDELVKMGIIERQWVQGSHRIQVKKAYPAYFDSYERFDEVVDYLKEISNLYPLGRNGQHRYNNMDHSMMTALRAVDALRAGGTGRKEVWDVNTEQEYHEEAHEAQKEGT